MVAVLVQGVLELGALDMDRRAGKEPVAAAVVEVQMRVDDNIDALEVEVLGVEGVRARIEVSDERMQLRQTGVDKNTSIRVVDEVCVHGHPTTLDEQVSNEERSDRDLSDRAHRAAALVINGSGIDTPRQAL